MLERLILFLFDFRIQNIQEAHKIEAQKTVMDSTRMEEKMAGITSEQKEIGNSETIILTKAKVEKQLVIVNSIMSEEKFSQVVIENVEKFGEGIIIENDEKLEDIELYLEESGRENIFVDQATISKQEHNDVSKTEHSGSYRGCFGDVNEKHLTKENSGRWYDSRQESGINTICEIFIRDRQVMEDQGEHGIWCKEGTTQLMMQQKELKTVDYLQNNSNNCIENNIYGSNVCNGKGRDVELPVHEMGDDVKCMYSPTKSLKVVGKKLEEADDSVPTFNHMSSNEHHEFMKVCFLLLQSKSLSQYLKFFLCSLGPHSLLKLLIKLENFIGCISRIIYIPNASLCK